MNSCECKRCCCFFGGAKREVNWPENCLVLHLKEKLYAKNGACIAFTFHWIESSANWILFIGIMKLNSLLFLLERRVRSGTASSTLAASSTWYFISNTKWLGKRLTFNTILRLGNNSSIGYLLNEGVLLCFSYMWNTRWYTNELLIKQFNHKWKQLQIANKQRHWMDGKSLPEPVADLN